MDFVCFFKFQVSIFRFFFSAFFPLFFLFFFERSYKLRDKPNAHQKKLETSRYLTHQSKNMAGAEPRDFLLICVLVVILKFYRGAKQGAALNIIECWTSPIHFECDFGLQLELIINDKNTFFNVSVMLEQFLQSMIWSFF